MTGLLLRLKEIYAAAARSSWIATGTILSITTALWVEGKLRGIASGDLFPLRAAIQLCGLWAFSLMCVSTLSIGRSEALEPIFGGLDRATRFHRIVAPAALLLAMAHPALLVVQALQVGFPVSHLLVPFSSPETRSFDIIATYVIVGLAGFAFSRRLSHERWSTLHRPIAVLFLMAAVNFTIFESGTPAGFEPLRTWMILLMLASAVALVYRVLLFKRFGNRYEYQLEAVRECPDETVELVMRPASKRMMYEPGTFVFMRVPGHDKHSGELHPFSISSTPVDRDLRLSIKMVGDFTKSLVTLKAGRSIDLYGPFGGFTPHRFAQYRRLVFIGAGIGITPFLSMLAFEETNRDFRRIWLYYVVRDAEHAPYEDEIRSSYLKADSFIDYIRWDSGTKGRLTAAQVMQDVQLDNFAVMLCGRPEFVSDLVRQFHARGVPMNRIITEELLFR